MKLVSEKEDAIDAIEDDDVLMRLNCCCRDIYLYW